MGWGVDIESAVVNIEQNKITTDNAIRNYPQFKQLFAISGKTELEDVKQKFINLPTDPAKGALARKRLLVIEFIVANVLAAQWYTEAMKKSWRWRALFGVATIAILFGLPLAMFGLQLAVSKWLESAGGEGAAQWTTGLTALATGLLGVQKAVATWIDNHKRYGAQWQARSDLRDILYTLGDKWCGRAGSLTNGEFTFSEDFVAALEAALIESRKKVRLEQQSFFNSYKFPSGDVLSAVAEARKSAGTLLGPALDPVTESGKARKKLNSLEEQLSLWEAERATAVAAGQPTTQMDSKIKLLKESIITAKGELAAARQTVF